MSQETSPFTRRWGAATDSEWLTALIKAINEPIVEGVAFPTLPETEVQRTIQGNSQETAVRGSFAFYKFIKDACNAHNQPLQTGGRFLDFGAGWGRITRPFMRDFPTADLYAVEPSAEWTQIARRCNPYISILQSDFMPPLAFRDGFFRYIVSYSIFSHLPEPMFDDWMQEFERILQPGGILVFTFLGNRLMKDLERYPRPIRQQDDIHFWHRILLAALEEHDPKGLRYAADEFIFLPTGQTANYGDTFMSPDLVRSKLRDHWHILEINSDALSQDVCVVQKR